MKSGIEITEEVLGEYPPGPVAADLACATMRVWPTSRR